MLYPSLLLPTLLRSTNQTLHLPGNPTLSSIKLTANGAVLTQRPSSLLTHLANRAVGIEVLADGALGGYGRVCGVLGGVGHLGGLEGMDVSWVGG